MRISFLAVLTWAVQLKALPSAIGSAHAVEMLTLPSELAEVATGPSRPWGSDENFQQLDSGLSTCEGTEYLELKAHIAPHVQDCSTLRDQIADKPGIWYITSGKWMSKIARCTYHPCH